MAGGPAQLLDGHPVGVAVFDHQEIGAVAYLCCGKWWWDPNAGQQFEGEASRPERRTPRQLVEALLLTEDFR
ncbi:hypothetical protein A6A25_40205 [Saccharothrix sp. CB00851]|nr:hypothetical protein A6A25_40205 [Saccharothrix sp. CB00851]